jgi:hypothetical protein
MRARACLAIVGVCEFAWNGHDTQENISATWRGGGHLIFGANVNRSVVTLSSGSFTAVQAATEPYSQRESAREVWGLPRDEGSRS